MILEIITAFSDTCDTSPVEDETTLPSESPRRLATNRATVQSGASKPARCGRKHHEADEVSHGRLDTDPLPNAEFPKAMTT